MNGEQQSEFLTDRNGGAGRFTLNRPAVLNALTIGMIRGITRTLKSWSADENVGAGLFFGAGGRAFCAGGDIKAAAIAGQAFRRGESDINPAVTYFAEEYSMNRKLFHFEKPLVALMDGITMGGGFGVAGPCRFRVATEKTIFAMPEVGIGFFPDVGSAYFLTRAPGAAGMYLAVTGGHIGPEDAVFCGLATHFVPSDKIQIAALDIAKNLSGAAAKDAEDIIANVLASYNVKPAARAPMEERMRLIDRCFAAATVEEILENLSREGSEDAQKIKTVMAGRSPLSMKVARRHVEESGKQGFDDITAQDYILSQNFMAADDFYEGVRAALIDKDKNPRWNPSRLEDITQEKVEAMFRTAGPTLDEMAA